MWKKQKQREKSWTRGGAQVKTWHPFSLSLSRSTVYATVIIMRHFSQVLSSFLPSKFQPASIHEYNETNKHGIEKKKKKKKKKTRE